MWYEDPLVAPYLVLEDFHRLHRWPRWSYQSNVEGNQLKRTLRFTQSCTDGGFSPLGPGACGPLIRAPFEYRGVLSLQISCKDKISSMCTYLVSEDTTILEGGPNEGPAPDSMVAVHAL